MQAKLKKSLRAKYYSFLLTVLLMIILMILPTFLITGCARSATPVSVTAAEQQDSAIETQPQEEQAEVSAPADEGPASLNADKAGNFAADGTISDDEYSGYRDLDGLEVYWANDEKNFYIAMKAETEGFVAIGIQPGRTMKDADMIYGYIEGTDIVIFDMFSTGNFGPHPPDVELGGTDDILDFGGSDSNGYTIIEFQRLLSTGDKYDIDILTGVNKIIWAYGNADSPGGPHAKRGYGEIVVR
jgi:hypothetical protein